MDLKGSKTEKNLLEAFAGESQARNKYSYYASKAKKEGYEKIAVIFEETANNEKEHAKMWFKLLNGIGSTAENLEAAAAVVKRSGNLILVDDDRLPLNPGEKPMMKRVRFRTLGCYPLTGAIESDADTLDKIVQEMLLVKNSERQGRVIDYDGASSMEEKKKDGYF